MAGTQRGESGGSAIIETSGVQALTQHRAISRTTKVLSTQVYIHACVRACISVHFCQLRLTLITREGALFFSGALFDAHVRADWQIYHVTYTLQAKDQEEGH